MTVEELHPGKMLGQYELLLPLATGATASVWAARITGSALEKIVAVKAMRAELEDDAETMFLDEARIAARIRHPNVASVIELGETDDALYIVMEWIDGEPLQVLSREAKPHGGIPLALAVRIARQAAAGLHAAHELCDEAGLPVGLVHRDISPQNILVGFDGSVKVIDFGVAKATSNLQRTAVGQLKGKAPYMAPEQARGEHVDRRADVFALGVVLFQLATGKHPFRADNDFATIARLTDGKPLPRAAELGPVPAPLDEVIATALAKPRDARFPTMLEMGRALDRAAPAEADGARVLGDLARLALGPRAQKRNQAIREALRSLGHKGRPVNLSVMLEEAPSTASFPVASVTGPTPFPPVRPPTAAELAAARPAAQAAPVSAAPAPAVPAPPPSARPPSPAARPAPSDPALPPPSDPAPLTAPTSGGRRRALIVAALLAVVALAIAAWATRGGGDGGPEKPTAPRRSW